MLTTVALFSASIPVITGLIYYKRFPLVLSRFWVALFCSFMIDVFSFFTNQFNLNNSFVLNVYALIYPILWSYPFLISIEKGHSFRKIIRGTLVLSFILMLLLIPETNYFMEFNGKVLAIASVQLIITILIFLVYLALHVGEIEYYRHPLLLIGIAVLLFNLFHASIFSLINQLDANAFSFLWTYRNISYIILCTIITYAFFKFKNQRT